MAANKPPILIVDDEPEILYSLRALLRQDFEVHTAESGAEALEVLTRQPVHVIMTDQRMPNMTGVELLTQTRGRWPDAVRIIFTGYADIKAVVDGINRGQIYRYLTKPWDPEELREVILQAVAEHDRTVEARHLLEEVRDYLRRESPEQDGQALRQRLDHFLGPQSG
jgi:DNA-binding NtrC family response regulator